MKYTLQVSHHLRLHSLIVLSELPEAKVFPSGQKITDKIDRAWPDNVFVSANVSRFQSLIVLSSLPEAKILLSGLKLTDRTQSSWPDNVLISAKVSRFHSLIVLSELPQAKVLPFAQILIAVTHIPCLGSILISLPFLVLRIYVLPFRIVLISSLLLMQLTSTRFTELLCYLKDLVSLIAKAR